MYKIREDIVFTKHQDGTTVLLSVLETENCYFKITGISQDIFKAISEGKDLQIVKKDILTKYSVDETTLDKDIALFLSELKTHNIIEEK